MASIIRPRLNDYYQIPFTQEEVDFAIPFLDEDIPLYVDPFLLWKSPSQQDNALHTLITNSFNQLGFLFNRGNEEEAVQTLINLSECNEVGLGNSKTKEGKRIGKNLAYSILSTFKDIPQISKSGFIHFEEIQLLVNTFSKDRVSDIACNFLFSFLVDYTWQQSEKYKIPREKVTLDKIYNSKKYKFEREEDVYLPINPITKQPIVFVPKRWLKFIPWINLDDYFQNYYQDGVDTQGNMKIGRIELLEYNRNNYDLVAAYSKTKERQFKDCKNDPLFRQIPVTSARRKLSTILALPTGKTDNADKKYEENMCQLMASLLYPHLDFAQEQSRTDSNVLIRDLIFYNNKSFDFLSEIYDEYESKQIVFELKNVRDVSGEHIAQLNRYLSNSFGRFGVIITRNPPKRSIFRNTIDLWSAHRKCILIIDDTDVKSMVQVFESRQRSPIEYLKKKYIEFTRACPN